MRFDMADGAAADEKVCTKCGEAKPASEYYVKREHGRERLASHCKGCHLGVTNAWQATNRHKVRSLRRGYDAAAGQERRSRIRAWQKANPEKLAAHAAVHAALRTGELERPEACSACGCEPGFAYDGRSLVEAHHDDYAQPLVVRWLCSSCHKRQHGEG